MLTIAAQSPTILTGRLAKATGPASLPLAKPWHVASVPAHRSLTQHKKMAASYASSSEAAFVRPDCPPIDSFDEEVEAGQSASGRRKGDKVASAADKAAFNTKQPKFRSALEQVSWMNNNKLEEQAQLNSQQGLLGFLGL